MLLKLLPGLLIGGVIGLITNGIAIRMLFRPIKAYFIFNHQLPFTPGLIPKEKPRIAKSLGQVVAGHLLTEETIQKALISEEIDGKIIMVIDNFLEKYKDSDQSLEAIFFDLFGEDKTQAFVKKTQNQIVPIIFEKINSMDLGPLLSQIAVEEILNNIDGSMFAMFVNDALIDSVRIKISQMVDKLVYERGGEMIETIVDNETDKFLLLQSSDLITNYDYQIKEFKIKLIDLYHQIIENHSKAMIQSINLGKLVEDQINAFDVLTFEKLILDIMNRELRAIVWLGGFLGAVMGLILSIIQM